MNEFIQEIGSRRLFHKRLIDMARAWIRRYPDDAALLALVVILLAGVVLHGWPYAVDHSPLLAKIFR